MRQWQVAAGLIYGQVKKSYRRRKLVRVTHVMRLGTEDALKAALQGLGFSGRLNTAFIERVNLTVRHGVAALARRTWATAQQSPHLLAHLEWWRAYYHFVRPHGSLRVSARAASRARGQDVWRNATDNGRQPWQQAEPPDDGRRGRCSLAPCPRFPLKSHRNQVQLRYHVVGSGEVPAEALGWRLTPGRGGLSGLTTDEKQPEGGLQRLLEFSTMSHGSTHRFGRPSHQALRISFRLQQVLQIGTQGLVLSCDLLPPTTFPTDATSWLREFSCLHFLQSLADRFASDSCLASHLAYPSCASSLGLGPIYSRHCRSLSNPCITLY